MTRIRTDIPKADTPEAKERRQFKPDLSKLDASARARLATVEAVGLAAFGSAWKTPLAAALGYELRRTVTPAQVQSWISGARPVPASIMEAIEDVAWRARDDLEARLAILRPLANPDRRRTRDPEGRFMTQAQFEAHISATLAEMMDVTPEERKAKAECRAERSRQK
jgi:hypothetical protein